MKHETLTSKIITCAIEVHRHLGPGLLESAYEHCLAYEFSLKGLNYELQTPLPVVYKNVKIDCAYRMDIVVEKNVVLELKCVNALIPIHHAQLLTYLKLSGLSVGLLLNFNEVLLKDGIKRMVL